MDTKSSTILGACIVVAALLVSGSILYAAKSPATERSQGPAQTVTTSPPPRFQFIQQGKPNEIGDMILFDTATGRVWFSLSPKAVGGAAFRDINPMDLGDQIMPKK
jgi:hypothetical protein